MKYNKETFSENLQQYAPELIMSQDTEVIKTPIEGFPEIKNRFVAHPIEGCDAREDGGVSDRGYLRYKQLARGGAGVIWVESTAVDQIGRTNDRQLWIRDCNLDTFSELADTIHKNGCGYVVLQLTHAGRNSQVGKNGKIPCVYDNSYLQKENLQVMSDEELEQLVPEYVKAAKLAAFAGFNAVDIRVCHGYLLNELLGAYNRQGKYGGSLENRSRLILQIVSEVRKAVSIDIAVRLNIMDGLPYPYGWGTKKDGSLQQDLSEPLFLAGKLLQEGVSILNISAGIGAVTPYMIRPFDKDPAPEHPLVSIDRLLSSAKAVKEKYPQLTVVASGFTWLRDYAAQIAAGCIKAGWFDLAGFGRASIVDPAFAEHILTQQEPQILCNTCGGCTQLIKNGKQMRCVRKPT